MPGGQVLHKNCNCDADQLVYWLSGQDWRVGESRMLAARGHRDGMERWRYADACGALLSLGCVIHCAAAPLILVWLPLSFADWLWSQALDVGVAVLTAVIVAYAVVPAYRLHRHPAIPFLATLGCGLVILGSCWPCSAACVTQCAHYKASAGTDTTQSAVDQIAGLWTPVGAAIITGMHIWNVYLQRRCRCAAAAQQPVQSPTQVCAAA